MTQNVFLRPLDVLYLRGNRLFEGAGAYGEALMPPWPSLAAGAIRSRMLADAGEDIGRFAAGARLGGTRLNDSLGTPAEPGAFRVSAFVLARRNDPSGEVKPRMPLPGDVIVTAPNKLDDATYLRPCELPLQTSANLPKVPVLEAASPCKPTTGLWLDSDGWVAYLQGQPIRPDHLKRSSVLWGLDSRLGIALDDASGTAATGNLYTAETVALREDIGFLVRVEGADGLLPESGLLRLGGDGRGSAVQTVKVKWPEPDWEHIEKERRFRVVLSTPGIFPNGWLLPGCTSGGHWCGQRGMRARLVAATVARAGVVSGWDLARRQPKTARRTVPVGSVYWFENLEGGTEGLRKLSDEGLWSCMTKNEIDSGRRAEGFNNIQIAAWPR